jgi:hypothetical protein
MTAPPSRHRRAWLALAAAGLLPGCAAPPAATPPGDPSAPGVSPLPTPTAWPRLGTADLATTHHGVNRLTWGANDTDMAQALALGRDAWLRAQLSPALPAPLPAAAQAQIDALDIQRRPLQARWQSLDDLRTRVTTPPAKTSARPRAAPTNVNCSACATKPRIATCCARCTRPRNCTNR